MAKITIDWSTELTTSTGKTYKKVAYITESGEKGEAGVWSDAPFYAQVAPGASIEAEIKVNGQYTNLVAPRSSKIGPSSGLMAQKEKSIAQAQERKERSISAAQDRSALMWAKYGACEIVAHHPAYRFLLQEDIPNLIEDLSTRIYNGELTEPFTS